MTVAALSSSYMALLRQYPLHPIRNHRDYRRAIAVLDKLAVRGEDDLDEGEADYLGVLTLLVEAYDREHAEIEKDARPPHERLQYLMKQAGMTPGELAKVLGVSQPAVSLILHGRRGLTRGHMVRLGKRFSIEPGYFL